jgi:hypothetical protein
MVADAQGNFGFYSDASQIAFSIVSAQGVYQGTYQGTLAASGADEGYVADAVQPTFHIGGDSYNCRNQATVPLGCRGINAGGYGTTTDALSISGRLAAAQGFTLAGIDNLAGGGAEAADVAGPQIAATYTPAVNQRWEILVGLNDASTRGVGVHQQTTRLFRNFAIARAAMQPGYYMPATSCTITNGVSNIDNTYAAMPGVHFSGSGTMVCTLATTNTIAMIGYLKRDGSTGSFSYSVSGATTGAPVTATTAAPDTIYTTAGHISQAPAAQRNGLGLNAGTNVITINIASDATIYWIATPAPASAKARPSVFVGGVPATSAAPVATTAAYDTDAYNDVMQFIADGWSNVQYVPVRSVTLPRAEFYLDGTHPLDPLAGWIANAFTDAMAGSVRPGIFPVMSDDTGVWPNPLQMVERKSTGFGPQWFTDNTAQGGVRWNHILKGPSDPTFGADGVGCEYVYDQTNGKVNFEYCPTGVLGYDGFFAHQTRLFANRGVKGPGGGPTVAGSVGYSAGNVLDYSFYDFDTGFYGGGTTYARRIYGYQGGAYGSTFAFAPDLHKLQMGGVSNALSTITFSSSDVRSGTEDVGIGRTAVGELSVGNGTVGDASSAVKATQFRTPTGNGFTGTKTAGSCVLTISGGIITNVSGC